MKHGSQRRSRSPSRSYKSPRRSRGRRARRRHGDNRALAERRNLERLRRSQDGDLDRRLLRNGDDPAP